MADLPESSADLQERTTLHVLRARGGDPRSLAFVVERFSPLLLAQARYRLGPQLRRHHDPEDLVADVWAVALPRLAELDAPAERAAPALLRFLATTLVYRVNNLVRRHIGAADGVRSEGCGEGAGPRALLDRLPAETAGVVTRVLRAERDDAVRDALESLDAIDREVVVLRGIEQHSNERTARQLGLAPNTVSHRYRRALQKLRARLQGSVFAELWDG